MLTVSYCTRISIVYQSVMNIYLYLFFDSKMSFVVPFGVVGPDVLSLLLYQAP